MLNGNEKIIKHKTGLLNLAQELGNVSKACQIMGMSRDTFYRYKAAVEDGGIEALMDKNRRKPNLKNRVDEATEQRVLQYALDFPAHGQVRTSCMFSKGVGQKGRETKRWFCLLYTLTQSLTQDSNHNFVCVSST